MLDTLGRAIGRHPWVVILLWIIAVVLAMAAAFGGVFGQPLFARLSSGQVAVPGQTQDGTALLEQLPQKTGASVILLLDRIDLRSGVLKKQIALARKDVLALPYVAGEKDPFARDDRLFDRDSPPSSTQGLADLAAAIPLVSQDRTALLMIVDLKPGLDTEQTNADLAEITARVQQISPNVPGSTALAGGATQILN